MKTIYIILIMSCISISCSDDGSDFPNNMTATSISFVYSDGSLIPLGACLSDEDQYAIQITTTGSNNAVISPKNIEFTFNGILYSQTFSEPGNLQVPVSLIDGNNTCQLVISGLSSEIRFVRQGDFRTVD